VSVATIRRTRTSVLVWMLAIASMTAVHPPVAGALASGQRQPISDQRSQHALQRISTDEDRARRACRREMRVDAHDSAERRADIRRLCRELSTVAATQDDSGDKSLPWYVLLVIFVVGLAVALGRAAYHLWRRF
jgi:hypothetical protein